MEPKDCGQGMIMGLKQAKTWHTWPPKVIPNEFACWGIISWVICAVVTLGATSSSRFLLRESALIAGGRVGPPSSWIGCSLYMKSWSINFDTTIGRLPRVIEEHITRTAGLSNWQNNELDMLVTDMSTSVWILAKINPRGHSNHWNTQNNISHQNVLTFKKQHFLENGLLNISFAPPFLTTAPKLKSTCCVLFTGTVQSTLLTTVFPEPSPCYCLPRSKLLIWSEQRSFLQSFLASIPCFQVCLLLFLWVWNDDWKLFVHRITSGLQ